MKKEIQEEMEKERRKKIYDIQIDTLPTAKVRGFYTARNAGLRACLTSIIAIGVCAQTPLAT